MENLYELGVLLIIGLLIYFLKQKKLNHLQYLCYSKNTKILNSIEFQCNDCNKIHAVF